MLGISQGLGFPTENVDFVHKNEFTNTKRFRAACELSTNSGNNQQSYNNTQKFFLCSSKIPLNACELSQQEGEGFVFLYHSTSRLKVTGICMDGELLFKIWLSK